MCFLLFAATQVQVLKSHLSQLYQLSDAQKQAQQQQQNPFQESKFDAIAEDEAEEEEDATPADPISSMCQQLSQELSALSNKEQQQSADKQVSQYVENTLSRFHSINFLLNSSFRMGLQKRGRYYETKRA